MLRTGYANPLPIDKNGMIPSTIALDFARVKEMLAIAGIRNLKLISNLISAERDRVFRVQS